MTEGMSSRSSMAGSLTPPKLTYPDEQELIPTEKSRNSC
jgi:hypothetical protein